jgi:hypothetical protein
MTGRLKAWGKPASFSDGLMLLQKSFSPCKHAFTLKSLFADKL